MPTFSYASIDSAGKARSGTIEASDKKSAIARISADGRYVTSIEEANSIKPKITSQEEKKRGKASRGDLALFTRRFADLSSSGLPLDRVLQVLAEQTENGQLSHCAEEALNDVRGGLPVSAALAKHDRIFPEVYTMTLRAGEASGQLPESAERLADLLENEVARRSQVVSALIYPGVLTATAIFVVIFLLTFVVPKLSGVFKGLGDDLPASTKLLLGITTVLTEQWYFVLGGLAIVIFGGRAFFSSDAGALMRDRFMLNAPVFGPTVKKAVVSRYSRVLGTLVSGGVPILDALELAGLASGNRVFRDTSREVEEEVRQGRQIAQAMIEAGAFPPVLTHMVAIGEETGDLSKMLDRVSNSLDFEVETSLRRLTSLVEPLIVLTMGAFVAFVVISVMLPIFQAQDLVK